MKKTHEDWMQDCLELGEIALQHGNPPVGSLLVQEGQVLGRGIEAGKSKGDITYHAEIEAIRDAVRHSGKKYFSEAILYTTHEPCIMCSYVIRHHRIASVVIGLDVPEIGGLSSGYPILKAVDIQIWDTPPRIIRGVLQEACQQLQDKFLNTQNRKK